LSSAARSRTDRRELRERLCHEHEWASDGRTHPTDRADAVSVDHGSRHDRAADDRATVILRPAELGAAEFSAAQ
jgi:hypothetical protein